MSEVISSFKSLRAVSQVFILLCCSVVFDTLADMFFLFSVMWSELLMTPDISSPLWTSVYECQRVECAFRSPV